jgi:hypothetical protein
LMMTGRTLKTSYMSTTSGALNTSTSSNTLKIKGCDAPPSSLMDSLQVQRWKQQKERKLDTFLNSLHFKGRGACWSSRMEIRKIDMELNYSHGPAQTKQQVS